MGPSGHMLTFPINHGQIMNVVAFRSTEDDWSDTSRLTKSASRQDALRDFDGFGDNVMNVLKLAEPELDIVSSTWIFELHILILFAVGHFPHWRQPGTLIRQRSYLSRRRCCSC